MRKFRLFNNSKTSVFDFESNNILITELSGLGISYALDVQNGFVTGYTNEFEDITLTLNLCGNPYTTYSNLMQFIASNGKNPFVLEYSVNEQIYFAEVWVKKLTKTQKTTFSILTEVLTLHRQTHWFRDVTVLFDYIASPMELMNDVDEEMPVNFEIVGPTLENFSIDISDPYSNIIASIKLLSPLVSGEKLLIDSFKKKVFIINQQMTTNGYNRISKNSETFIVVNKGVFYVNVQNIGTSIIKYSYRKWVLG